MVEVGVFVQKDICGEYIVCASVQLLWCFSACVVLECFLYQTSILWISSSLCVLDKPRRPYLPQLVSAIYQLLFYFLF